MKNQNRIFLFVLVFSYFSVVAVGHFHSEIILNIHANKYLRFLNLLAKGFVSEVKKSRLETAKVF